MTSDTPVLRVDNVSKSFGGLAVVQNVTFDVEEHGRVALIGPNGAGKTTIFNLISGVYRVDLGRIELSGTDVTTLASRRRIDHGVSRSFQNVRLMQHLTVLENLLLGQHHENASLADLLTPFRFRRRHRWLREAAAALEAAGLGAFADATVQELPYGVRKRVDLVRATLVRPKVLLLDEPAAGLNPAETKDLIRDLERLSQDGIGLVIVEHDMAFVREFCHHVVVLNFGKKIAEGSMAAVQDDPLVREAYLGSATEVESAA